MQHSFRRLFLERARWLVGCVKEKRGRGRGVGERAAPGWSAACVTITAFVRLTLEWLHFRWRQGIQRKLSQAASNEPLGQGRTDE